MRQILDDTEYRVLKIVDETNKPIGTWAIENKLREDNVEISTATVGRILSKLESNEFLEKFKNEGRVITSEGKLALKRAETIKIINYHQDKLNQIISTEVLENFVMIIQARRAIEKETCRLATRYITQAELDKLKEVLDRQEEKSKKGESIADEDIEFHRTIAKASRNAILESLYNIVSTFKQQSNIFEKLRRQINSPYNASHKKIYEAIKNNDEEAAEKLMSEHMDHLMEDVLTYWNTYGSSEKSNR
ncbi:MAG: FCD domain-containing protein [Sedimentibacter sp.]|uniref:FCD domain-containing protein n=1 Tax=Sedimentibacter sp. TaxID=1960295 RepID=UPI00315820ED